MGYTELIEGVEKNDEEEIVTFNLAVKVPYVYARAFAEAMTGKDDDIVLAAETAIREKLRDADLVLPYGDTYIGGEEVELAFEMREAEVREELSHVRAL